MTYKIEEIPLNRIIVANEQDINFKAMMEDYSHNFAGRMVRVETNYNLLSSFVVSFNIRDFPHLMGWNKLRRKRATELIKDVQQFRLTKDNSRSNHNWHQVSQRMLSYNFLHRIFYDQDIDACVLTRDMKPNRLKLDIVFLHERKKDCIVLGLRKSKNQNVFVPTTLHVEKLNNEYEYRRKTRINKIEWVK
ncbi:PBECR4 domain-containing protein [Companilactobacillus sp.]|uniref:PBECR4 domain-containing protein n=1 Tax=Companilactobacillus sp. TaxID=2767905 RepID=UPI0026114024|nr:PBECR4 domain-containing protein [Companilactobacillus sp.]